MQLFSHLEQLIFNLFLLGLIICGLSLLNQASPPQYKPQSKKTRQKDYHSFHLVCLLEDAPSSSLKGQAYELASPLMTPLACVVPDTWRLFYKQSLAQSGINYWEWRDKPESDKISAALSDLFRLKEPKGYAKEILEVLAERKNPFFHPLWCQKNLQSRNLFSLNRDFSQKGKFADQEFQIQFAMRHAFKQWHQAAIQQLGRVKLSSVYQQCYGVSWEMVQEIIRISKTSFPALIIDQSSAWWEILGVSLFSRGEQVEKNYKFLVQLWHPDRNPHPNATEVTIRLNNAYQQYQALPQAWPTLRKWLSTEP